MSAKELFFFPGIAIDIAGTAIIIGGILTGSLLLISCGVLLFCIALAVFIIRLGLQSRIFPGGSPAKSPAASSKDPGVFGILYADSLISVAADSITFHHYSSPFFTRDRCVPFTDIRYIEVRKPTVLSGKWRIGGSGDLATWFPFDTHRPSRDRIFRAILNTRGMNVGFTVERSDDALAALKKTGVEIREE